MSGGGIFLVREGGLLRMLERHYEAEDLLQRYLSDYPDLLAGDQTNPTVPRRWLLISREIDIPDQEQGADRWSLDHLFVDQDGIPTLVEVKRSTDTRARREVVAQMLDYAANAVAYWPAGSLESTFRESCRAQDRDPDEMLAGFLEADIEPTSFWRTVDANLEAARIRLIFLSDTISVELQRIVNLLAQQFRDIDVLAIEVKQFLGGNEIAFVPRLVTEPLVVRRPVPSPPRHWDETSFLEAVAAMPDGRIEAPIAKRLIEWAEARSLTVTYGGSVHPTVRLGPPADYPGLYWLSIWMTNTEARLETRFVYLRQLPPLRDSDAFDGFARRLAHIPGMQYGPEELTSRPGRPLRTLADLRDFEQFTEAFDWLIDRMRHPSTVALEPSEEGPHGDVVP